MFAVYNGKMYTGETWSATVIICSFDKDFKIKSMIERYICSAEA